MKRAIAAAALVVTAFNPFEAAALPPPPEVAVVLVTPFEGREDDASRMLESLDHAATGNGWYTAVAAPVDAQAFSHCVTDPAGAESCARSVLADIHQDRPPIVVVFVMPGPGFHQGWTCVGVGDGPTNPERQTLSLDTMEWRAASQTAWERDRPAVAGCVLAAASESGW